MAFYASGERTLEKYKIFPFIAWTIVIGFALFVYHLTMGVRDAALDLNKIQYQNHSSTFNREGVSLPGSDA